MCLTLPHGSHDNRKPALSRVAEIVIWLRGAASSLYFDLWASTRFHVSSWGTTPTAWIETDRYIWMRYYDVWFCCTGLPLHFSSCSVLTIASPGVFLRHAIDTVSASMSFCIVAPGCIVSVLRLIQGCSHNWVVCHHYNVLPRSTIEMHPNEKNILLYVSHLQ